MKEQASVDNDYGCIAPGTETTVENEVYALFPVSEIVRLKLIEQRIHDAIAEIQAELKEPWETNANTSVLYRYLSKFKGLLK